MDSVSAIIEIRDNLRSNLTDPYITAGGSRGSDTWIFSDEPHTVWKFPVVELKKSRHTSEVLDIGYNYMEWNQDIINVWFRTKNGFKITVGGVEYSNAQLVDYYLGLIKDTLKDQASVLHDAGVKMYKCLSTSTIDYDKDTQLYYGFVTIRVAWFKR